MSRARSVADLGNQTVLSVSATNGNINVGTGVTLENTGEAQFSGIVTAPSIDTRNLIGNVSIGGTLTYEDVTSVDSVGIITARSGVRIGETGSNVLISGSAAGIGINTTAPGGSTLAVVRDNIASFSIGQNVDGSGQNHLGIYYGNIGAASTAANVFTSNGDMNFWVDGAAAPSSSIQFGRGFGADNWLTMLTSGNIGIGSTIPSAKLDVRGDITATSSITGSNYEIAGISSSISDSAIDVFVYDTSKDSDGGAWRKRTKHTSWYNETLNTATRGSRREFPAVAVIVREPGFLTIYDGDDPNLPMWMVFEANNNGATSYLLEYYTDGGTSVTALNGIITSGHNANGATTINFINEKSIRYRQTALSGTYEILVSISERNTLVNIDFSPYSNTIGLIQSAVNDVAMVVRPNAPIDVTTGLPIPIVAVASSTSGGVTIIKEDGNTANLTGFSPVDTVHIDEDNVIGTSNSGTPTHDFIYKTLIPSGNEAFSANILAGSESYYMNSNTGTIPLLRDIGMSASAYDPKNDFVYRGGNAGFDVIMPGVNYSSTHSNPAIAYIASDYNTGYMPGDIKGAFLSSTDATNMTGGNLVTNGDAWSGAETFTSSTPPTGWSGGNAAQFRTNSGGDGTYINLVNAGSAQGGPNSYMYQAITTVAGRRYKISLTQIHHATITVFFAASTTTGGNDLLYTSFSSSSGNTPRELSGEFTATGTTTYIRLGIISGTNDYWVGWDNVVVTEVDEDRSINANGLHSFGTITKTAVATGAELVSYSGFNATNNLVQLYNSDLNFGTGNFCFVAWIKKTSLSTNHYVLDRNDGSTENDRFAFMINAAGTMNLYSGATNAQAESAAIFEESPRWRMVMVKRESGTIKFGLDGKEYTSTTTSGNWSTTDITGSGDENLFIGQFGGGTPGNATFNVDYSIGEIANVRLSASAPSTKQFKKMYDDEKFLYQENTKATLYGSSDAVTGLAYDDITTTLHAGTSAGRSEFQGLCRINNTTVGITSTISASNGFVAEK